MKALEYPFDSELILRKKRSYRRQLLNCSDHYTVKRIAILGGSTTSEIKNILELFLLNNEIKPLFYESDYNKYYEESVFNNPALDEFNPDIVYIHTSIKNLKNYPKISDTYEDVQNKLEEEYQIYFKIWTSLFQKYGCVIIQNNFELPYYRLLGNKDVADYRGRVNFISKLNIKFSEFADKNDSFYINDINYLSAQFGLDAWSDPGYWYLYKYSLSLPAIPTLSFNLSNIIKGIYGKNKKAFALDLDNTLWGGVIGDDGVDNIDIGHETPRAEAYSDFQQYLKDCGNLGVILNIISKNDLENAQAGLNHPDSILNQNDFIVIKSNWEPKSKNLYEMADELDIGIDSIVFVDDNPAERELINQTFPEVITPNITNKPENYIKIIDHSGLFESVTLSSEDYNKSLFYKQNFKRNSQKKEFDDYNDYLMSLDMEAEIADFSSVYYSRIAQLVNKSNQFNFTTKRYSQSDIEFMADNKDYVCIYGRLIDKFGDNGLVSVIVGSLNNDNAINIELFLMSCRVLKRGMENAMMDAFVKKTIDRGVKTIYGYYYPTQKNRMVKELYSSLGFSKFAEDDKGNTTWSLCTEDYIEKNCFIKFKGE